MRTSIVISRVCAPILAIAALTLLVGGVSAATKQLSGTYSVGKVGGDCINAGGRSTSGTGPGGYGCIGPGGTVSCTAKGKCTGTCQACGDAVRQGGLKGSSEVGEVLGTKASSSTDSATANTPPKPTQTTQKPNTQSNGQTGSNSQPGNQPPRAGSPSASHK